MRKAILAFSVMFSIMLQAQQQPTANPFFDEFATVHNSVPFSSIENKHYEEAIDCGIEIQNKEIADIVNQSAAPTFDNTIVALERSGSDLNRVLNVFYPMLSALSDDELMDISLRVSGKLSKHSSDISLNEGLWKRIKTVYDMRDKLNLDAEDSMLLTTTYDSLVGSSLRSHYQVRSECP